VITAALIARVALKVGDDMDRSEEVRRGAEDKLRESEDRFRDLVEHSQDLICTHDLEGRILSANPWAATVLGIAPEELLRMNFRDLLVPEVRHGFGRYLDEIRTHGTARGMMWVQARNGERRLWEYKNTLRTEGVAEPIVRGMAQDITERKRSEDALKESEEKFRLIFDNASDGILLADTESMKFEMGNRKICEMLGYGEEEIQRLRVLDIHPEKDLPYALATFQKGATGWMNIATDIPIKRKDGSVFISDIASSSITFHGKQFLMGIFRDLTRERLLQRQLQTAQRMESVGTLAGGIAHDFNNVLTVIVGFGEMLKLRVASDRQAVSDLDEILSAAERAAALTRQLLTFARRQVVEPVNLDLNEVMTGLVKLIRKVTREDIVIKTFPDECPVMIHADRGQVEQVLMNLSLNARDAMPEGGQLVIETGVTLLEEGYLKQYPYMIAGRYAVLSVSDTGIGMDEKTRERVFEPFFTTKGPDKGTGLGLAMVYGIVKQHNGYIHLYSEPGKGTAFRVYFPTVDGPADAKVIASQGVARGGSETILLAEDNESVRHLTEQMLTSFGYKVLIACDGEEAIDIFLRHQKDIAMAVLDVVMPKKGGKQAYDEMAKIYPGLKVLFLSGYSANAIHESFVLLPGLSFLQKPFSPDVLIRKVREVLDTK
jgi:two-component system, cell cycle sensor histidine kinase and response regulator CckA